MNGALMKKKKQHTKQINIKNGTTEYNKSKGGSVRPGSKLPFQAERKLVNIMLAPQVQRKRVLELGSAEPEGALVLSCPTARGKRSKSLWDVLYEWKSREWLNSRKYAEARP